MPIASIEWKENLTCIFSILKNIQLCDLQEYTIHCAINYISGKLTRSLWIVLVNISQKSTVRLHDPPLSISTTPITKAKKGISVTVLKSCNSDAVVENGLIQGLAAPTPAGSTFILLSSNTIVTSIIITIIVIIVMVIIIINDISIIPFF